MKKFNNILKDTFKRSMYFNIVYITIMYFLMFYNYAIVTNEIFIGMLAVVLLVWFGIMQAYWHESKVLIFNYRTIVNHYATIKMKERRFLKGFTDHIFPNAKIIKAESLRADGIVIPGNFSKRREIPIVTHITDDTNLDIDGVEVDEGLWLGIITNFRVKDDGYLYGDIRFRNSAKDRVHKHLGDFEHLYLNVNYRVDGSMRFTSVIAFTVSVH